MMNVFENLNEQQAKAVRPIEGAMLVLAGAGSGKTTVLTRRIIHMIESGIDPKNILAITFSNRAAEEMRSRIVKTVPNSRGMDVKVKTFHALCAEILRCEKAAVGNYIFNKQISNFVICSLDDCRVILQDAINESGFAAFEISPADMLDRINILKNEGITTEEFKRQSFEKQLYVDDVFLKIYKQYQAILQRNNCLDFNDLILYVLEIFEKCPEILQRYQQQYRYIMVDEYQDTNHLQYQLVQLLAAEHRNLCVVGDDDQSIYSFRGADINNILNFEKDYPEALVVKLEQNYRSSGRIVNFANSIIVNNKMRIEKTMQSMQPSGSGIKYGRMLNDKEEAAQVVQAICKLHNQNGVPYKEIAVLYRKNDISQLMERELRKKHIPYKLNQGTGLFEHKETKDVLAYLRLLDNLGDDISLKRIINVPTQKIGDRALDTLACFARKHGISLWDALKRREEIWIKDVIPDTLPCFVNMMEYLKKASIGLTIESLIKEVLKTTGYMDFVIQNIPRGYTAQYVYDLLDFAKMYDESEEEEKSLNGFLEKMAFMNDVDKNTDSDAVSLLTGHSCKGLEFDAVFIIGLEDGILPHSSAIESSNRFMELEEERRLFYVMVTRARKFLCMTSVKWRSDIYRGESRFKIELGK